MKASKIPLIGPTLKRIYLKTFGLGDNAKLKTLQNSSRAHCKNIYTSISELNKHSHQFDHKTIEAIENERGNLLQDLNPLVDDAYGEAVEYDTGVTVKRACEASKDYKAALFLFFLTKNINPQNVLELGTNVGISSSYIATALQESTNQGHLTTMDASLYRQAIAKKIHEKLNFTNIEYVEGFFSETLDKTLQSMKRPIDLAFIDGHHQYKPTLEYFNQIYEYAGENAVFVFDDIRWSKGMKMAWNALRCDKRFDYIVDLFSVGVCVTSPQNDQQPVQFPLIYNKLQ